MTIVTKNKISRTPSFDVFTLKTKNSISIFFFLIRSIRPQLVRISRLETINKQNRSIDRDRLTSFIKPTTFKCWSIGDSFCRTSWLTCTFRERLHCVSNWFRISFSQNTCNERYFRRLFIWKNSRCLINDDVEMIYRVSGHHYDCLNSIDRNRTQKRQTDVQTIFFSSFPLSFDVRLIHVVKKERRGKTQNEQR